MSCFATVAQLTTWAKAGQRPTGTGTCPLCFVVVQDHFRTQHVEYHVDFGHVTS